jgi:uncharacterized protein (TIRG00374 family)
MLGMNLLTFIGLALLFNIQRFQNWRLYRRIIDHPVIGSVIKRTWTSIFLYRRKKGVLFKTCLLSLAAHLLIILEAYCLGRSFQIHLGLIAYLTVIPLIMAIAALPITPGGLGIREGLSVALFGALGIGSIQSQPLALMFYLISLVWSLFGGIIFLGYTAGAGRKPHEELLKLRHEASSVDSEIGIARSHP